MDDLIAFLRARLDDDERIAQEAKPGPWHNDGGTVYARHITDEIVDYTDSAEHIARHDPARVLADVAAKRQIIDTAARAIEWSQGVAGATAGYALVLAKEMLRALALPFVDHPDYREEWRP